MTMDILTKGTEGAGDLELEDQLHRSLIQAQAMVHQTFGVTGEAFRDLDETLQDKFLLALSDTIDTAIAIRREQRKRERARREATTAS